MTTTHKVCKLRVVAQKGDEEESHSEQLELGHLQRFDEARKELDETHLVHHLVSE